MRAPRGYGPHEVARKAEADGTDDDRRQPNDEYRFSTDRVSRVAPNVAAQETAKREGARDVACVVACCKSYPRTTAATVNAVGNPLRSKVFSSLGTVLPCLLECSETNLAPTVAWGGKKVALSVQARAQSIGRFLVG